MPINNQRQEEELNSPESISRISAGSVIKGEVTSPADIRIDGTVEGKIISQAKVIVGENAVITGDVICSSGVFWGTLVGDLYVKDTLSLKESCDIKGNLHVRRLQMDLDAKFNGNCRMISEEEFNRLTMGSNPDMYQVEPKEEVVNDEFAAESSSEGSPFSLNNGNQMPEA